MRTSTADKLDLISDNIDRRNLLDINNDYTTGSSSETDESDTLKFQRTPSDLLDLRAPPHLAKRNGSYFLNKNDSELASIPSTTPSALSSTTSVNNASPPPSPLRYENQRDNSQVRNRIKKHEHEHEHEHEHKHERQKKRPFTSGTGLHTSESDITLDGLVKYVSNQDKARLNKRHQELNNNDNNNNNNINTTTTTTDENDKTTQNSNNDNNSKNKNKNKNNTGAHHGHKRKDSNSKYRLRFGDLTFGTSSTTILDSQEFINSQFFGMYVLFWLATAFIMLNNFVHIYFENATPIWNWTVVRIIRQDLFKVAFTDLAMYLGTYMSYLLQVSVKHRIFSWRRVGWIVESVYEAAYFFTFLWFSHYMQFPWIARVFLVLHSLVFVMKMHSFAFYNGYLWGIYTEGLFSESYLHRLLNDEVDLPKGFELDHTLKILEGSIEFAKYELEYQSKATSDRPDNDKHKCDGARLDISIEELQRTNCILFPQNINLKNYFEYSMFPTLVYTILYPRTNTIRWSYVFFKTFAVFGLYFLMITIAENSLLPIVGRCFLAKKLPLQERVPQYFFILLDMIPPFLMEYLFTFILIWDSVLNALAELTMFADRDFYGPWWSCTDFSDFARLWNKPVHNFLLRHVYHSSISAFKVNKIQAAMITFIILSIVHELVMYVIFGIFRGYLLLFQMSQIPLIMLSRSRFLRGRKILGNIICWFGFISGPSIIFCLYLVF